MFLASNPHGYARQQGPYKPGLTPQPYRTSLGWRICLFSSVRQFFTGPHSHWSRSCLHIFSLISLPVEYPSSTIPTHPSFWVQLASFLSEVLPVIRPAPLTFIWHSLVLRVRLMWSTTSTFSFLHLHLC